MHSSPMRLSEFRSIGSVTGIPHKRPFTSPMLSTSFLPSRSRNLSTILSQLRHQLFPVTVSCIAGVTLRKSRVSSPEKFVRPVLCYRKDVGGSGEVQVADIRDVDESSQETNVSYGETEKQSAERLSSNDLMQKLKRYGVAGVLSYGLLNTVYYLTTFLFVWFYFAPAAGRMGYAAAVKRFLKLMAMVWAGSQVTKILRAGGALALAPFVGRGLSWFTSKVKFESEGKAFAAIVGLCFGLALLFFLGLTVLWA